MTQKVFLTKTNCLMKSLNTENKLSINGSKSGKSLVVYRLTTEKSKDLLKRAVSSSDSSQSSDTNPHKKRYLVSQKSGLVYEILSKDTLSGVAIKREFAEPESDLICDDEYFKYIGLIGSNKLVSESKSSLNQWPLRSIARVDTNPQTNKDQKIILTDICPKSTTLLAESEVNCGKSDSSCEVSRRKLAKHQWRTEVVDNSYRLDQQNPNPNQSQNQLSKVRDESTRKRDKEMRDWEREALHTISCFELSSFMGKRIFRSLFSALNDLQKYLSLMRFENYCLCDSVLQLSASYANSLSNVVSRMTRAKDSNDWNPRHYQHKYCFNRMQRLEKWRQLETGLNRRSRILKSRCKRLVIRVNRIIKCPICAKSIEWKPRHQCYEFESHLRPENSLTQFPPKDSSNEIIIIGDDFMDERFDLDMTPSVDMSCDEEVIKAAEDDDIFIIGEVIRPKPPNPSTSALKLLLQSQFGPKPIGLSHTSSLMSCNLLKQILTTNESSNCGSSRLATSVQKTDNYSKQKDFVFGSNVF